MTTSTPAPIRYPLDLSGRSPDNLIVGEAHTIGATGNRAIVLAYGPFFTRGLVVRSVSSGLVLTPRVHYKAAQLFVEATIKTGQEVCSVIVVDDPTVGTDFTIDYQTIGGDYTYSVDAISALIDTLSLDDRPVRWGSILGKPEYFPPTPHLHDLGDLYGFEYVTAAIEGVRQAILYGDVYKDQEIYDYIDQQDALLRALITNFGNDLTAHIGDLNNPHQTTKDQVGLGLVENLPIATDVQARAGTSNVVYMTALRTKAAVDVHATRVDNPHNVTKTQVGLGLVSNFAVCTLAEALAGVSQTTYTTPFHVQAMIDQAIDGLTPTEPPYVAPNVSFTTSGSTLVNWNESFSIGFTDKSTAGSRPIVSWEWDFGDGSNFLGQSPPAHSYEAAGDYTATLTVKDDTYPTNPARTYSVALHLTKNAPPSTPAIVDFSYTGSATTTDPNNPILDFAPVVTVGSTPIASYLWEFDVTNVASLAGSSPRTSTVADPTNHQYAMNVGTTTITVRLTVTDTNGLSASKTKQIVLTKSASNVPPTSNFTYTGATTVTDPAVHLITFTDQSVNGTGVINAWAWDFGDGTTYSGKTPPAHQFAVPVGSKSFIVKLTTTDTNGLNNVKQITLNLTKNAAVLNPPTAGFNTSGATTVLEGTNHSISVTDTSVAGSGTITSWLWDWGDGTTSTGKTPAAHSYTVAAGTTVSRTITLTVTDSNGKSDSFSKTLSLTKTAITPPTAGFTFTGATTVTEPSNHVINFNDASVAGTGSINKWVWSFGDGTTYTGQSPPNHTYNAPIGSTNYVVKLTVTDTNGRTNTKQITLTLTKNKFTLAPLANLSFESGDTKWTKTGTTIITNSGTAAQNGTWRARINYVSSSVNGGAMLAQGGKPCVVGDYVKVACYVRPNGASDNVGGSIRLMWLDYWGNTIGSVAGPIVQVAYSENVWTLSATAGTAPEGAYYYSVQGEGFVLHAGAIVEFDNFDPTYTGVISTPPGGGGGGGGTCVGVDMWMDTTRQAGNIVAGDVIDGATYSPDGVEEMLVTSNSIHLQPVYRMITESGIALVASDTTPFTLRDGSSLLMPKMLGQEVLVDDEGDIRWELVTTLVPAGMQNVAFISIENHSYFAGEEPTRRIASHNILKNQPTNTN